MNELLVSSLIAVAILAAAWIGGSLRRVLPEHHLTDDTKDMVKVGIGFLATLAAMVLGLLVASAKSSYDTKVEEVQQLAAKLILLDHNLRDLGPDVDPVRERVRATLVDRVEPIHRGAATSPGLRASIGLLFAPSILTAFAFFALIATSLIGIQTFSVSAMVKLFDAPLGLATGALTAFLLGSAAGILMGGFLADRTSRHDMVAAGGLVLGAVLSLVIATGLPSLSMLPGVMALMGFCLGVISPSRDMLVRAATPPGASGKVYGFVYSGLDLGSCLTPLLFGWLLDRGEPRMVFVTSAAFMLLTIATAVQVRRRAVPAGREAHAHR